MCKIAFDVPDEVLRDNKTGADDAIAFARRATALGLCSQRGVSLGYCAQIAGMDKAPFVRSLGDNGVPVFRFDSDEEFLEEMAIRRACPTPRRPWLSRGGAPAFWPVSPGILIPVSHLGARTEERAT